MSLHASRARLPGSRHGIVVWLDDNGGCIGDDVVEVLTGKQSFTGGTFDGNVAADEAFLFAVP
jgi:hypothetical protein